MILGVFLASWKLKKRGRQKVKLGRRKREIPVVFLGDSLGILLRGRGIFRELAGLPERGAYSVYTEEFSGVLGFIFFSGAANLEQRVWAAAGYKPSSLCLKRVVQV